MAGLSDLPRDPSVWLRKAKELAREPRTWSHKFRELLHPRRSVTERAARLRGIDLYERGDILEARRLFGHLLEIGATSEWTFLWAARAEIEMPTPDWGFVESSAEKALRIRPGWPPAHKLHRQLTSASRPIVVPLLGLSDDSMLEAATDMRKFCAPNDVVIVTDSLNFAGLFAAGIKYEYLPPAELHASFLSDAARTDLPERRIAQIARERRAARVHTRSYLAPTLAIADSATTS